MYMYSNSDDAALHQLVPRCSSAWCGLFEQTSYVCLSSALQNWPSQWDAVLGVSDALNVGMCGLTLLIRWTIHALSLPLLLQFFLNW